MGAVVAVGEAELGYYIQKAADRSVGEPAAVVQGENLLMLASYRTLCLSIHTC